MDLTLSGPGWTAAITLLVLSSAARGICQFCPGVASSASRPGAQDPISLCGGTTTACGYQCCVGDYCYSCGCKEQLTSGELAVSDLLCGAGNSAKNLVQFCTLADPAQPNATTPTTAACISELVDVYFALCSAVLTGTLGQSKTHIGSAAGLRFEPGECLRVPPDTEYCPKQFPRPACCQGDGSCTSQANGRSRLCVAFQDVACCPPYQTFSDSTFVATCAYSCCLGDWCYHCDCTGSMTFSEIALQNGFCLAASSSTTASEFCYNVEDILNRPDNAPRSLTCQSSSAVIKASICAPTNRKDSVKVTPGGSEFSPANQVLQPPSPSAAEPPNPSQVRYPPGRCVTVPASQRYCPIAYPQLGCCALDGSCTAVPNGRVCELGDAIACCHAIQMATSRVPAPTAPGKAPARVPASTPLPSQESSGYFCIGLEATQQLAALCDGTTTTCSYQCCSGDFCYFCGCADGLTASEAAVQARFCEAALGATNLTQFCNASSLARLSTSELNRKFAATDTCKSASSDVYDNMCNPSTLAGLSDTHLPTTAVSHKPGECVVVTSATPHCPKSYPNPACCDPVLGVCASQVNGRSLFCLRSGAVGCCPPYPALYSNFSSAAPPLPMPAASAPTGALPLRSGLSAPVPAPSAEAKPFFCPGHAYVADIVVTNCDGGVTTCKTRCCSGDSCFYCQCSGRVTASEQAAIDGLCIPAQTARTALEFCTAVHNQLMGPNQPGSQACSSSSTSTYNTMCFPTLYDTIITPASYAFRALYPPDNAGTPVIPAWPVDAVSFPPSDCLLMPYDIEYCPATLPYQPLHAVLLSLAALPGRPPLKRLQLY
ncbi:hypothetical protein WJX72_010430 [[Myrmecia] bisecta]|uniref:Uncharacterized protein n=1 Tax=[Myrmecia] bisecta TaxID=41462 RepID=A0AAW1P8M9_9CHLO